MHSDNSSNYNDPSGEKQLKPQWGRSGSFGAAKSPPTHTNPDLTNQIDPTMHETPGVSTLNAGPAGLRRSASEKRSGQTLAQSGGRTFASLLERPGTHAMSGIPGFGAPPVLKESLSRSSSDQGNRGAGGNSSSNKFGLNQDDVGRYASNTRNRDGNAYKETDYGVEGDLGPGLERRKITNQGLQSNMERMRVSGQGNTDRFVLNDANGPVIKFSYEELLSFNTKTVPSVDLNSELLGDLLSPTLLSPVTLVELETEELYKEWYAQVSKDREKRSNRRSNAGEDDIGYNRRPPPGWVQGNHDGERGGSYSGRKDRWDRRDTPGSGRRSHQRGDMWQRGQKPRESFRNNDGETFGDIDGSGENGMEDLGLESMAAAAEKFRAEMEAERRKQSGEEAAPTKKEEYVPAQMQNSFLGEPAANDDILNQPLEMGCDQPPEEHPVVNGDPNFAAVQPKESEAPIQSDNPMDWMFDSNGVSASPWDTSTVPIGGGGNQPDKWKGAAAGTPQHHMVPQQVQQQSNVSQHHQPQQQQYAMNQHMLQQQQQHQFPQQQSYQQPLNVPQQNQQQQFQPPQPVSLDWFYKDPSGNIQGPFKNKDMREWFKHGYFKGHLPIRRGHDGPFIPLATMFTDLNTAFNESPQSLPGVQHGMPMQQANAPQQMNMQYQRMMMMQQHQQAQRNQDPRLMAPPVPQQQRMYPNGVPNQQGSWNQQQVQMNYAQQQMEQQQPSNVGNYVEQQTTEVAQPEDASVQFAEQQAAEVPEPAESSPEVEQTPSPWGGQDASDQQQTLSEIQKEEALKKQQEYTSQPVEEAPEPVVQEPEEVEVQQEIEPIEEQEVEEEVEEQEEEVEKVPAVPQQPAWGGAAASKPSETLTLKQIQEQEEERRRKAVKSGVAPKSKAGMSMAEKVAAAAGIQLNNAGGNAPTWNSQQQPSVDNETSPETKPVTTDGKKLDEMSVDLKAILGVGSQENTNANQAAWGKGEDQQPVEDGEGAWSSVGKKTKSLLEIQEEEAKLHQRQLEAKRQAAAANGLWGETGATSGGWASKVGNGAGQVSIQQQQYRQQVMLPQQQQRVPQQQVRKVATPAPAQVASTTSDENAFGTSMSKEFRIWATEQVEKFGADIALAEFCYTLESNAEIREYMREYLGSTPQVSGFASEFIRRKPNSKKSKSNNNDGFSEVTRKRRGR